MSDAIRCPECGMEIGKYIFKRTTSIGRLGNMNLYDAKYDFRKAAHIGLNRGLICKKCARKYFPEGVAYRVTVDYHGKRITPYIGIKRTGLFATRIDAFHAKEHMNEKSLLNDARYEEVKL